MARTFTGTDTANSAADYTLPTAISMTAWCYGPTSAGTVPRIVQIGSNDVLFGREESTGQIRFERRWSGGICTWLVNPAGFDGGAWQHVAVTYDGSDVNNDPVVYQDGVDAGAVSGGPASGTLFTSATTSIQVGNRTDGARPFLGTLAHVAIYNVVLTASEVRDAMRHGYTPRGLQHYYPLWGVATTETDEGGGLRGLTLTGSTVVAQGPPVTPRAFVAAIPVAYDLPAVPYSPPVAAPGQRRHQHLLIR